MTDIDDRTGGLGARASATARGDRDRILEAIHALEADVGRPLSSEPTSWRDAVRRSFEDLHAAFGEQRTSYDDANGLMAVIARDEPRLRTWVRQLQHRWTELESATVSLRDAVASDDALELYEVRERVRWLAGAIRHHREREADLVFEALGVDLGEDRD